MLLCAGKVLVDADTAPEVIRLKALSCAVGHFHVCISNSSLDVESR